jgi:superfamily II DNA or RNA helicase
MSTKFFTNREGNTLLNKFHGVFSDRDGLYAFHAITGFFRSSGYFAIRDQLLKLGEVKILVGIEADKLSSEAKRRGILYFADGERIKSEFLKNSRKDIAEAGYTKEVEDGIMNFLHDLMDGKIQIRIHKSKKLHAKIYIFLPQKFNEHNTGYVITGSSNLTGNGLGVDERSNFEFNVGLSDYEDVAFAEKEFQQLWDEGEELLPDDAGRLMDKTHLGVLYTPYEIYLRLLIEYFGRSIDYDPDTVGDMPRGFKKLSYQVDAINEGYQMLLRHNGFMLADVVGLGKTVIATQIARRFAKENGRASTKILVVYPPAMERAWKDTFKQFGLDKDARFITNGSLHKILEEHNDYWTAREYDMIIVDEAHKFRSHTTQMFDQLQTICKAPREIIGGVLGSHKKIILVSATPLNNRPEDIYYQLQLFQNLRKTTIPGIPNLQKFFGPLLKRHEEIRRAARDNGTLDLAALRQISEVLRTKILEPVTVRRTRKDINNFPAYLKDLKEQQIVFPDIADPRAVIYELKGTLEDKFYQTIDTLTDAVRLGYYRYQAIRFLNNDVKERNGYTQAERISRALAFIMRTGMVKRLESSFYAFKKSLGRLLSATKRMIQMFDNDRIFILPGKDLNKLMDKGWTDEMIEDLIEELAIEDPRNAVYKRTDFQIGFYENLKTDATTLQNMVDVWEGVKEDPKLDEFLGLLDRELLRKDINPSGKLVIFTESKETADYLEDALYSRNQQILNISSHNRDKEFNAIRANFDANLPKTDQKHDYDIIISTEVLAEGINLHRANTLINYDTPWNASRLMQRLGRINRIGSSASMIYHYSFYPSRQSERYVQIYNNAFIKLQTFHTAYGEDARIYSPEEVLEDVKLHTTGGGEEEDRRLIHLKVIRDYKEKFPQDFRRLERMPLKARTGRQPLKQHTELSGGTLAFLKSSYKMEFYRVLSNATPQPITFLEAADSFAATVNERANKLPEQHYDHIQAATKKFEEQLIASFSDSVSGEGSDSRTNAAKKYLREWRIHEKDEKAKEAATALIELLEVGTITGLPTDIRKLRDKVDKGSITANQETTLIMRMATKYHAGSGESQDNDGSESDLPPEAFEQPVVIISETFLNI